MRHGFVEHDKPDDPMTSIRTSYANLVRLLPGGCRVSRTQPDSEDGTRWRLHRSASD
jgi:hypothetical protein